MAVSPAGSRRSFLQTSTTASLSTALFASGTAAADEKRDKVVVGVMGTSRGAALAKVFSGLPGVEVRYVCDVDSNRASALMESLGPNVDYPLQVTGDFRRILDDPEVDALICAAPNHWHAPAAIMACAAGKHCYVEKPCSHNAREGEMLVEAARKHNRCVQMGNQRRSSTPIQNAMKKLHEGVIGRVYYSRSWYANTRGPIGSGMPADVPAHIDYDLWQGPAPRQPFTSNRLHYNWHWVWHYGNGELGNNGVHSIDLCRWGLQAEYPTRVVSSGGRYAFDDDQQTADTHIVSFEFPDDRQIIWEGLSCNRWGLDGSSFGCTFHGTEGTMTLNDSGYTIYDARKKEVESDKGADGMQAHAQNFVDAIRQGDSGMLNSEILEGHRTTLLCHLGNIAYRTGDALTCDAENGRITNSEQATAMWGRDYAPGWEPKY
ncbi:MAG: Gfo/Idh/MocA family protein [Planctomycetaceae bacterium]|jgi:predicted dehydrogenase